MTISNFLQGALTVKLVATISAMSRKELSGSEADIGLTAEEAQSWNFGVAQAEPNFKEARRVLKGTKFEERLGRGVKDAGAVKNELVYFLSAAVHSRNYEEKNRIIAAISALGYVDLAFGLAQGVRPVEIITDEDCVVVRVPKSEDFNYHARKNGWKYHGGSDGKWRKNPPYRSKSGEILEHVRQIPAQELDKLHDVLQESFKGRLCVTQSSGTHRVDFID